MALIKENEIPMHCRIGCGACCIAPSISSSLPGMPGGKPAGVRCVNLTVENVCRLWGTDLFPSVCLKFKPEIAVCGNNSVEAMSLLANLEKLTRPDSRFTSL